MSRIILASASPRRRELLTLAGVAFTVETADTDETVPASASPEETVRMLSRRKAEAVAQKHPDAAVIGADTVVEIDGRILGKPADDAQAKQMLAMLSGRTHHVHTGVTILRGEKGVTFHRTTAVTFYPLTASEIDAYVATGDCRDKAGAYGVQSRGCMLVEKIDGDYFNVVGLPVAAVVRALRDF